MKKTLSKAAKTTISIICILAILIVSLAGIWMWPVHGEESTDHWHSKMEYTEDYAINIEKQPDKDFEILAISDTQLSDTADLFGLVGDPLQTIETLINNKKPDLIVVMGDVTWMMLTKVSVKQFVSFMDKFDIPWAPIMGNHEDEKKQGYPCSVDLNWVADEFLKSDCCLFKKGPNNIGGVGNYVINITENGKIKESLIFMDSHAGRIYPELNNEIKYDYLYDSQLDWYEWVVNGNKALNGGENVESMVFMHIPLQEYDDAYNAWEASGFDPEMGFGEKNEKCCPGYLNSGMFDLIKELGSTKYVFAAHDHLNNYSVNYEGIQLTYTTKTGDRCSHKEGLTGGTRITIGDKINIEHEYVG